MTSATPQTLTLTRPDDWHLHVRDGDALNTVVPHTAVQFGRAIIMPNLRPPVTTAAQAVAYRQRIQAAVPKGVQFEPLMRSSVRKMRVWWLPSCTRLARQLTVTRV
jgi:dihydroorotase